MNYSTSYNHKLRDLFKRKDSNSRTEHFRSRIFLLARSQVHWTEKILIKQESSMGKAWSKSKRNVVISLF